MSNALPVVYLARHGETAWSLSGQHTGLTDLPLTAAGEAKARALGARLAGMHVDHVLTSPLVRAKRTCELAGFGGVAAAPIPISSNGTTATTKASAPSRSSPRRPGWKLFRDGCPGRRDAGATPPRAPTA